MTTTSETIAASTGTQKAEPRGSDSLRFATPVLAFVALVLTLAWGLTVDPKVLPSTLMGKHVPHFDLPLVNVFASLCSACRAEHPLLMQLKAAGVVAIYGHNYKDQPDNAENWLDTLGDPYTRTGADRDGRVAIDWGVYGVPETFVITKDGRIAHKHIGQLTDKDLERTVLPMVERLRRQ